MNQNIAKKKISPVLVAKRCIHCKNECVGKIYYDEKNQPFCCRGCLSVYNIISLHNLKKFYQINSLQNSQDNFQDRNQVSSKKITSQEYLYLDSDEFIKRHITNNQTKTFQLSFYLEGVHCLACLWLIEKIPEIVPNIISARLDLGKNTVLITGNSNASFAKVAFKLHSLGYKPHPILENNDHLKFKRSEEKKDFLKLGIAGFCAMNIMLYSVSIYSGVHGFWKTMFDYFNFALTLPIVFFCAKPFYFSAITSIKNKTPSIDTPISLAIIAGFILSTFNLFVHKGHHQYFDSITILVFFLLLARIIQKIFQGKHLNQSDFKSYFYRSDILRWNKQMDLFEYVREKDLLKNDLLKIKRNEIIPVDGIIENGKSNILMSVLNGEPIPTAVEKGDLVFAGTTNVGFDILIKVQKMGNHSKLGKIIEQVKSNLKGKVSISTMLQTVSNYFIKFIFLTSAISFIYFYFTTNLITAIERSFTLLIVTCPCALALAAPLAFSKAFNLARKHNLVIKDESVFEKANLIKNIFLDKTGTITNGIFSVCLWQEEQDKINNDQKTFFKELVYKMESDSQHPLARGIIQYLDSLGDFDNTKNKDISNATIVETIAKGVEAQINNNIFYLQEIRQSPNQKILGLKRNNKLVVTIILQDNILKKNIEIINFWSKKYSLFLISGDNKTSSQFVGGKLNIQQDHIFADQTPKSKATIIDKYPKTLMIGDGFNDTLAFTKSTLSIAISGSVESSLKAADVLCLSSGLKPIDDLLIISKETIKMIKRNIFFSIIYNCLAIYFVFAGLITPIFAAILMPISSLSVILSTIIGTKKLRKLNRDINRLTKGYN